MRFHFLTFAFAVCLCAIPAFSDDFDDAMQAAARDDIDFITKIGNQALFPSLRTGWTLLHEAANNRAFKVASYLIKLGANVNALDGSGHTPLLFATRNRDDQMVRLLVEHHASCRLQSGSGTAAIDLALRTGYAYLLGLVLARPASHP